MYETWAECREAVRGRSGAVHMKVSSAEEAQAILSGRGVALPPGLYAFTDGNALGGVGVVIVEGAEDGAEPSVVSHFATSVARIFRDAGIPGLDSDERVAEALGLVHHILAELAALYRALLEVPEGSAPTIVHDYVGVGAFMEGRWRPKNPVVRAVVSASLALAVGRGLELGFRHQPGHRSDRAGRHDFARFNAWADSLATEGSPLG